MLHSIDHWVLSPVVPGFIRNSDIPRSVWSQGPALGKLVVPATKVDNSITFLEPEVGKNKGLYSVEVTDFYAKII